jgi:glyoxylase-like metal-dependent hydrolase (beta-lactamase superfamily II)
MIKLANALKWDVLVTKREGLTARDLPPGKEDFAWVPTSATLIYGRRDAVLVDAFLTIKQADALADWVAATGKNLTTIYVTHGHGDHFFGIGVLQKRFPNAKTVARPAVVDVMQRSVSPENAEVWNARYPGQIPERLVVADKLQGNVIDLEGHDLVAVDLGHTDTDSTTCLHVPSAGLVVAGDAAYNDVHLFLAESDAKKRREWMAALDTIEALEPRAVIAGHKHPERDDSPRIIEETRGYIRDFSRIAEKTTAARELYDKMLELYPDRANPGALWLSASAAKEKAPTND